MSRAALDPADVAAIVSGDIRDPFAVLGMHAADGAVVVRVFRPDANAVQVVDARTGRAAGTLERRHEEGLFEGVLERKRRFRYRLRVESPAGATDVEDPYRFGMVLGQIDLHLLADGTHWRAFDVLGAHPRTLDEVDGIAFAVWAPNARRVSVVGEFNAWDGRRHPMRLRHECGVWELFVPHLGAGAVYKYEVRGPAGEHLPLRSDPYAFATERPPATASIVHARPGDAEADAQWRERRAALNAPNAPLSIYEVHAGSWRRRAEEGNRYLSWHELADELLPYARDMGFTHLELLPVCEHPFDGSWGYQPIGLFAPTGRFGDPDDFSAFVSRCHAEGLGIIVDWVPAHFPSDAHGLAQFDGTHLYEHPDPRRGRHRDWGTLIYDYGRREVVNFLVANALFWIERYRIDGLRVDAVASMLYLDYSRGPGEWAPNVHGGNENLEAIDFLRRLNDRLVEEHPGAATMAEESTSWPMVSRPTRVGGLGFDYKWNMGWMHDTLDYIRYDSIHRRHHHDRLTFGLVYAFGESFVLPLSHDEVVHMKGSLIGKMPGDRWRRFANLRAYYGFMFTHPGKKLLFMGGEIAQEREWNHDAGLDWHLLEDDMHAGVQRLVRDLNHLYRELPALHRGDCDARGFEWIDHTDVEQSVICYLRRTPGEDDFVAVVCNFTPVVRRGYRVGVPEGGAYRERLNTDAAHYGGSGVANDGVLDAEPVAWHGRAHSLVLTLPPLATIVLVPERTATEAW